MATSNQRADDVEPLAPSDRRTDSVERLSHFKVGKFVRFDRSDLDSFVHSGEVAVGHDELEAQVWSARQRVRT